MPCKQQSEILTSKVRIDEDEGFTGEERSRVKARKDHPREKMPHQGVLMRGMLRKIGMEPIRTMVTMMKEVLVTMMKEVLTRQLWHHHPREKRPHQGIQTRALIDKRMMEYSIVERWINIILISPHQIYISIQHQQKGNISEGEDTYVSPICKSLLMIRK